jgi:NitT/TauT family transport system substrate-binding protein
MANEKLYKRFGLLKKDLLLIGFFMLILGFWVLIFGDHHGDGILNRPLRVGIVSWPGYAGGLMANKGLRPDKGSAFWRKRNLLVKFVIIEDEKKMKEEFQKGGENGVLDMMWATVDGLPLLLSEFKKDSIKAFMQVDFSRGGDAIVATPDIKTIEDLRGRKVASYRQASEWLLEYCMKNSGLTEDEKLEIRKKRRQMQGSKDAYQHFVDMDADVAVLWEPDVSRACKERSGAHVIMSTATAKKLIADVIVAKKKFIEDHSPVVKAFMEGWLVDGAPEANRDNYRAVEVLINSEKRFGKIDKDQVFDMLGKTELVTLKDNAEFFDMDGGDSVHITAGQIFRSANEMWRDLRYISESFTPEQAFDVRILKEVFEANNPKYSVQKLDPVIRKKINIHFQANGSDLCAESKRELDNPELQAFLKSFSGAEFRIKVTGNGRYDRKKYEALSQARAEAIAHYLQERLNRPQLKFLAKTSDRTTSTEIIVELQAIPVNE